MRITAVLRRLKENHWSVGGVPGLNSASAVLADLECGGWTPLWIFWLESAALNNQKIQSGVQPPHSKSAKIGPAKAILQGTSQKTATALLCQLPRTHTH